MGRAAFESEELGEGLIEDLSEGLSDETSDAPMEASSEVDDPGGHRLGLDYFGILFGPALRGTSAYQPSPAGIPDSTKPIILRNFLTASYVVSSKVAIAATGNFIWQPVLQQQVIMQDPFFRVSHNSLFFYKGLNLYGDARIHVPVTKVSQVNQFLWGVQSFQALTYSVPNSRFTLGVYASERRNFFGPKGWGNDWEFYFAPNLNYQALPNLALTVLYELYGSHTLGNSQNNLKPESIGLEPGLTWDVTPRLTISPYLHIATAEKLSLKSTAMSVWLSFKLL